jgi:hypothetical protein
VNSSELEKIVKEFGGPSNIEMNEPRAAAQCYDTSDLRSGLVTPHVKLVKLL